MDFRTYFLSVGEPREGLTCLDKSLTRQEFLKESFTSTIIERFARTGILTPNANLERQPMFGDFTNLPGDYFEAHECLLNLSNDFGKLPAKTRALFGNNPMAFVNFASNPANRAKAVELGIFPAPVKAKPSQPKPLGDDIQEVRKSGEAND